MSFGSKWKITEAITLLVISGYSCWFHNCAVWKLRDAAEEGAAYVCDASFSFVQDIYNNPPDTPHREDPDYFSIGNFQREWQEVVAFKLK